MMSFLRPWKSGQASQKFTTNRSLLWQMLHNQETMMATLQDADDKLTKLATDFTGFAGDIKKLIDDYNAKLGSDANQALTDSINGKLDAFTAALSGEDAVVKAADPGA